MSGEVRLRRIDWAVILLTAFFTATFLAIHVAKQFIDTYWSCRVGNPPSPSDTIAALGLAIISAQAWIAHRQGRTSHRQAEIADQQRNLMERQSDISERQLRIIEQSNRPLVLIQTLRWAVEGWRCQSEKTVFPAISLELTNFGNEVALTDYCRIKLFIGENPPKLHSEQGNFAMAMMVDKAGNRRGESYTNFYRIRRGLMPNNDEWDIVIPESKITYGQVDELATGHQKAWIDAAVFYADIRGEKHETFFRYVYDTQADMFLPDESAPDFNRHT